VRLEDVRDWLRLRGLARNAYEVVRFRKRRRGAERDLGVRLRDGRTLRVRRDCQDFHVFHRIWLRDEYRLARARPRALGCVVDLGANVGYFAALAAPLARRVICYEPVPDNFDLLLYNTAGLANVESVRAAVSDKAGTIRIYRPETPGMSAVHSAYPGAGGKLGAEYDEAPCITLDELFLRHRVERCDLLKVDVEGSEYPILYGASPATLARALRIYGEYHDVAPEDPRTRVDAFAAFLRGRGFAVEVLPKRRKSNQGMFFATRPGIASYERA
jgi:FkbM family methyltransferase